MSSHNFILPEQTTILEHQIAGHRHENGRIYTGMLKHSDGFVMKPVQNNERGRIEIEFYEQVMHSSHPTINQLKKFVPRFLGLHQFLNENSMNYFIKMEDVAAGLVKPCLADIKIGKQTWDPYSSPEKRLSENKKYCGTKEPLGFCIPGMCVHDLSTNNVLKLDKFYGRNLNTASVRQALLLFLNGTNRLNRRLLLNVLSELNAIRLWFEEQRHFLFYATSLLIVYDADYLLNEQNNTNPNVRIRMIDFAHVYPAHGSRDSNYLEGLGNLVKIFEDFSNDSAICPPL